MTGTANGGFDYGTTCKFYTSAPENIGFRANLLQQLRVGTFSNPRRRPPPAAQVLTAQFITTLFNKLNQTQMTEAQAIATSLNKEAGQRGTRTRSSQHSYKLVIGCFTRRPENKQCHPKISECCDSMENILEQHKRVAQKLPDYELLC